MSKLFAILLISIAFVAFIFYSRPNNTETAQINNVDTKNNENIVKSDDKYSIAWYKINSTDSIKLGSNLEEKMQSNDIAEKYGCKALVNAGFYSDEDKHIGLFKVDNQEIGAFTNNRLFNSVLYFEDNKLLISSTEPDLYRSGVQTGPRLISSDEINKLNLVSDKPARRMVYLSGEDSYFLAVYTSGNAYSGPYLAELGGIVKKFAENLNLSDFDAVNLDGGSASAFITPDFAFSEISPIGGYFCITD